MWSQDSNPRSKLRSLLQAPKVASCSVHRAFPPTRHLSRPPLTCNHAPGGLGLLEALRGLFKQVCLRRKIKQTGTLWGRLGTTAGLPPEPDKAGSIFT